MEYACGGELFNYIVKKKRLDEQETSFFFSQIISGLEYIHKNNIVHRDLKPENLLLTENNTLKIIDFGLSNQYKTGQTLMTPCGSPCYAAPEMILGKKYAGLSVDIWSTGIILFAMICGYLPFEDKNNDKLYKKILECKLDFPYHVSNLCKDLIKRILTVNPLKRIKLEEIKSHPFLKIETPSSSIILHTQGSSEGSSLKSILNYATYNALVLEKMKQLGFDPEEVISNLENNKHNNMTTTYYLLSNKEGSMLCKNPTRGEILNTLQNNLSPKKESSPSPERNSMKLNNGNNINININYLDKIGNINININEKKEENTLRESDLRNTMKIVEKDYNVSKQTNSNNINNINNLIALSHKQEQSREPVNFTEQNWTSRLKNLSKNPMNQQISFSPEKSSRKTKKTWQKSNTSFSSERDKYSPLNTINVMSNINKNNLNSSFTPMDLNSYLQTKKNESNNIILPTYMLPQVNRFTKIYSKRINKNSVEFYTSRKNYQSSKINTSVTLENSISHRSPSRETNLKSFIPRNTINLISYETNPSDKNPFKSSHKNSHSLTTDRNLGSKYSNTFKSETCTIDLVNEHKNVKLNKKEEKLFQVFPSQTKKSNDKTESNLNKTVQNKRAVSTKNNFQNIISDFKRRIKNLSVSEMKGESQNSFTFANKLNNSMKQQPRRQEKVPNYLNKNIPVISIQDLSCSEIADSIPGSNRNPNPNPTPSSTKNITNSIKFRSFKNITKNQKDQLSSISNNIFYSISNKSQNKNQVPSPLKNKKQNLNQENFKKIANYNYNTPVTTVNLSTQNTPSSPFTLSNLSLKSNIKFNRHITSSLFKETKRKSPKKSNKDSNTANVTKISNSKVILTPGSSKQSKIIKSSSTNSNGEISGGKLSEKDLLFSLAESNEKKNDFALITISSEKVKSITEDLKEFCSKNNFFFNDFDSTDGKYEIGIEDNFVKIELKDIENCKIMKLQHSSGSEVTTKEIIKNLIINIGF